MFVIVIFFLTLHPSIAIFQTTALGIAIVIIFGFLQVLLVVCMVLHFFYSVLLRRAGHAYEDNIVQSGVSKFVDIVRRYPSDTTRATRSAPSSRSPLRQHLLE